MDETLDTFLSLCQQLAPRGEPMVLATLLSGGSAVAGGRAWIDTQGAIYGAVTLGGCVDYQLRAVAQQVRATGQSTVIETQLGSDEAYEFGMTCSAWVRLHLQVHDPAHPLWARLSERRGAGEQVGVQTPLTGQTTWLEAAQDTPGRYERDDVVYDVIVAPWQLYIVGQGPIIQPLSQMARTLGMYVDVVDHLPSLSSNSLVVLASHQYDQEVDALRVAVASPARYIGLVASRRRGAAVLNFLVQTGTPVSWLRRVYTPAGLDLGQPSPAGIALSILAQITQVIWGGSGAALDQRADTVPHLLSAPATNSL